MGSFLLAARDGLFSPCSKEWEVFSLYQGMGSFLLVARDGKFSPCSKGWEVILFVAREGKKEKRKF
jgi:hypothetical protein